MLRRSRFALVAILAAAVGISAAWAQEAADRARDLEAARSALADRDPAAAEARLRAFIARWREGAAVEEATLLLGRAQLLAKRPEDALDTLRVLVEGRPDGRWSGKARWVMADAYAQLRRHDDAAGARRERVAFLASDDVRALLAGAYLEVADEAFEGREVVDELGRRTTVHDWNRALDFYRRARSVGVPAARRAEVDHRIGQSALEVGRAAEAVATWTEFLAGDPPAALLPPATYGLARALARTGRLDESRRRFREVVDRWQDSDLAPLALVALGDTWDPLTTTSREALERGLDAWREHRRLFFGHPDGPAVANRIGLALANFGDRRAAVDEWTAFLERWPDHDLSPSVLHGMALARLGLQDFDGAQAAWNRLLATWPQHPLWNDARAMLPRIAGLRGEAAMERKDWPAAIEAFEACLAEYPDHDDAPRSRLRLGDARREAGDIAGALAEWRRTVAQFPSDPRSATAWKRVADHLADVAGDLPAAIEEYEGLAARFPGTGEGQEAARILVEMRGKRLEAFLDAPLTTDHRPRLRLVLRNIDRLRMKAYAVDIEEFVRSKGGLDGAEAVITDVVRPDMEWTWSPDDHEPFRLLERVCELPVDGPGVWIVRAQDEELSATLLVISSDLAAVVKRSPSQTLVWVRNERTGEPVPDARVVLPGGTGHRTGADGVWIGEGVTGRVLVEKGGHWSFAAGPTGPSTAFGYSPKVYLFADRPLARPGTTVRLKGFARRVENGAYACRGNDPVALTVEDPRGAVLLERELRTDAFGGIETAVALPDEAALGDYRVTARYRDRSFVATFAVREYRKPEMEVDLRGERSTWLLGDEVKTSVAVRWSAGGVVPDAAVRWRVGRLGFVFDASDLESYASWFRDPEREAERRRRRAAEGDFVEVAAGEVRTDAEGHATIVFPTDPAAGDARYVLEVMVRDRGGAWVREAASFPVTGQAFHAVTRVERKVVKPQEEFAVEVFTVDANRDPVPAEGRVVLARVRDLPGRSVEEEVGSWPITTGEDGRSVVRVRADRPGVHALVFRAVDERGRRIEGRTRITVAGDAEDLTRDLKLVCDRETYREGDEASILLNVPTAPAHVLLTFEGERVLEHRVVRVTGRSTTLPQTMAALFSPNVFVRASTLRDGELLESGDEVLVFRSLQVTVEPSRSSAMPGDEVPVRIRTTDQRGNPVPAAVAVAAVDRALLALQPDRTPDPRPFFYDQRRTLGVATTSSFAHLPAGTTRPTNPDLLFEEARRLGRAGFERMQRRLEQGRRLLDEGRLDEAQQALTDALELVPGHYEARILLGRVAQQQNALKEKFSDAKNAGELADRLSREQLRKHADKDGEFNEELEQDRRARAETRFASKGRPAAEPMPSDDAAFDAPAEAGAPSAPIGGGGGAWGGPRPAPKTVAPTGGLRGGLGGLASFGLDPAQGGGPGGADAPARLRRRFADVAFWDGAVVTGADGAATVTITLPDNLTRWTLVARGASRDTLVGEGRASLAVTQPMLVRATAPRFLGETDRATFATVVHNQTGARAEVTASVKATGARLDGVAQVTAALAAGDVRAFTWVLDGGTPGDGLLTATVRSSAASDAAEQPLPVRAWGTPWVRAASGDLRDRAVAVLDLPEDAREGLTALRVTLSPSLDAALLDAVRWTGGYPYGCVEQTVNRFLPALAADEALRRANVPDLALRDGLRDRVERGLRSLYALQRDDGGWGWFAGGDADARMTAWAVLGLLRAERAGYPLSGPNRARAVDAARRMLPSADPDLRAFLLWALAHGGAADDATLASLHRRRDTLGDEGLAVLALALQATGQADRAGEAVADLLARMVREDGLVHWDAGDAKARRRGISLRPNHWPWRPDAAATARAVQALLQIRPEDPAVDAAVAWLMANRNGPAWRSTHDTGAVIDALAAVILRDGVERVAGTVRVILNDGDPAATVEFGRSGSGAALDRSVDLDPAALQAGRNTLRLEADGTARVHWTAVLRAVRPAGETIEAEGNLLQVTRRFVRYVPRRVEGLAEDEPVVGWECCDPASRPADDALPSRSTVDADALLRVVVVVEAREPVDYVIIEDPLPAGVEVVEGREEGGFDRFERHDDRVAFLLSKVGRGRHLLSYVVQGVFPGTYGVPPAEASGMYEPEVRGRSSSSALRVRGADAADPGDVVAITPDEVLWRARRAFATEQWEDARNGFRSLIEEWRLLPAVEVEAWAAVRDASLRLRDDRSAVEAHEETLAREPRRQPATREDRFALARAYDAIGEDERAFVLYGALAEEFWRDERALADAFTSTGDVVGSLEHRGAALRRFPDGGTWDAETLALAREQATTAGRTGGLLLPEAAATLRGFLGHRPTATRADEADMLLVDVLRRMELHTEALDEGARFLNRFPSSRWLDDVTWFLADAAWEGGDTARAVELADALIGKRFPLDRGREGWSPFRARAWHLRGKVAHQAGDLPAAVRWYGQARSQVPDAADAWAFLTAARLEVPELTNRPAGTRPRITIRRRNIGRLEARVYPVDFMILFAVRKDLAGLHSIDLTGLVPAAVLEVPEADAASHRWTEQEVPLPVTERGVYLVQFRGDAAAAAVVVLSDIAMEVQRRGDRVRVYVTDAASGAPVPEAYVKIGEGGSIRAQGFTDPRGVFEATGVGGSYSVVVEKDGAYALHRE